MFAADLHVRDCTSDKYIAGLAHMLTAEGADMLLLGGDYAESRAAALRFFSALDAQKFPMGIFGVLGNNDTEAFENDKEQIRREFPGKLLINETTGIRIGHNTLYIGGTDELKYGILPERSLFPRDMQGYSVLLSHYPCITSYVSGARPRLMLSGHTHGGQIAFMGLSAYTLGMERDMVDAVRGMHRLSSGTQLMVSPGVGVSRLPIRFCAEPLIHILEFK